MIAFTLELVQSAFLIIAAIVILIAAIGIFRLDDDMDKVIYVRMHMFGMMDIACVLAMIGLGQFLLAGIYFILAPFLVHAMANAYYYSEDERKYEINDELTGRIDDNVYNEIATSKMDYSKIASKMSDSNTTIGAEYIKSTKSTDVIPIKEVSTDDIENSNLNQEKGEEHD